MPDSTTAILMPNWIGDFVLALSVVAGKEKASENNSTLIVPENLLPLSKLLTDFPVIVYKRKSRREFNATIGEIKKRHFEQVVLLPHSFSSAWLAFRSGIRHRRGIAGELRTLFLTDRLPYSLASRKQHLTREYSSVLDVPFQEPSAWPGFQLTPPAEKSGAVVLCPGAAYGPAKQWPGFSSVVKLLPGHEFIILGDSRDATTASLIAPDNPHVRNLAGTTSLEQAVMVLAGASVVISNDSGLMHIAGYLGKPVVGIFGSTTPAWTRPLGSKVRIAFGECDCSPCFERTCRKQNYQCLQSIKPEKVVELVKEKMEVF
jgi:heptosyltransferase II